MLRLIESAAAPMAIWRSADMGFPFLAAFRQISDARANEMELERPDNPFCSALPGFCPAVYRTEFAVAVSISKSGRRSQQTDQCRWGTLIGFLSFWAVVCGFDELWGSGSLILTATLEPAIAVLGEGNERNRLTSVQEELHLMRKRFDISASP
mgnify:CR=1 FL=1